MVAAAVQDDHVTLWVVTHNPSDYPGKYCCRINRAYGNPMRVEIGELVAVEDTLEAVRSKIPEGTWL